MFRYSTGELVRSFGSNGESPGSLCSCVAISFAREDPLRVSIPCVTAGPVCARAPVWVLSLFIFRGWTVNFKLVLGSCPSVP